MKNFFKQFFSKETTEETINVDDSRVEFFDEVGFIDDTDMSFCYTQYNYNGPTGYCCYYTTPEQTSCTYNHDDYSWTGGFCVKQYGAYCYYNGDGSYCVYTNPSCKAK